MNGGFNLTSSSSPRGSARSTSRLENSSLDARPTWRSRCTRGSTRRPLLRNSFPAITVMRMRLMSTRLTSSGCSSSRCASALEAGAMTGPTAPFHTLVRKPGGGIRGSSITLALSVRIFAVVCALAETAVNTLTASSSAGSTRLVTAPRPAKTGGAAPGRSAFSLTPLSNSAFCLKTQPMGITSALIATAQLFPQTPL